MRENAQQPKTVERQTYDSRRSALDDDNRLLLAAAAVTAPAQNPASFSRIAYHTRLVGFEVRAHTHKRKSALGERFAAITQYLRLLLAR